VPAVARPDDDRDGGPADITQVGRDRRPAAAVAGHLDTVGPDGRVVVGRLQVQKHALTRPGRRDLDVTPVPDGLVEVDVADAREFGLGRERNDDLAVQGSADEASLEPGISRVEGESPHSVEVHPRLADEGRAGVFGSRRLVGAHDPQA